jgi:hypothetical protein
MKIDIVSTLVDAELGIFRALTLLPSGDELVSFRVVTGTVVEGLKNDIRLVAPLEHTPVPLGVRIVQAVL